MNLRDTGEPVQCSSHSDKADEEVEIVPMSLGAFSILCDDS